MQRVLARRSQLGKTGLQAPLQARQLALNAVSEMFRPFDRFTRFSSLQLFASWPIL